MTLTEKKCRKYGRLVRTIRLAMAGETRYAVEGSVFVGGSCIQWFARWLEDYPKLTRNGTYGPDACFERRCLFCACSCKGLGLLLDPQHAE